MKECKTKLINFKIRESFFDTIRKVANQKKFDGNISFMIRQLILNEEKKMDKS